MYSMVDKKNKELICGGNGEKVSYQSFRQRTLSYVGTYIRMYVTFDVGMLQQINPLFASVAKGKFTKPFLGAWRSGHRFSLRDRRPGFEPRQGIRFLEKTEQCCCVFLLNMYALFVC
jgi:hypothetical protein